MRLPAIETLRICVGYRTQDGTALDILPFGAEATAACEPIYEEMPGWKESTVGVVEYDRLHANARAYLKRLEQVCGAPIEMISTGPDRDQTIVLRHPFH